MQFSENIALNKFHTFHLNVQAKYFATIRTEQEVRQLMDEQVFKQNECLILGGGSNVLFTKNYEGLVLKNSILGKELVGEDEAHYYVKAGAGEIWHEFVLWCIQNNYAGLENLSLIPGCVGASPMQNIGAYGVEIKDVFHELEALHISTGQKVKFSKKECHFGYRESVFKNKHKNEFMILSVSFQLNKTPVFNTSYGAIEKELELMGVKELNIKSISDAVIRIRSSKLPDPKHIGNAGSFFKNPEVNIQKWEELKSGNEHIVAYPLENGNVKLAAGWLIEQCGWKGKRKGDAGVHVNQALVLVNYGNASGAELFELSEQIIETVKTKFGVNLEREVNII